MAYIKKLKDNELIGGTDNTDVYPVTSTEAVYNRENVSQEYINNHVDGSKIVNSTITTGKIADNAVTMGKLSNEVQTLIQQGADSSWTPKGDFNIETTYDANDVVFDPVTNSSYLSLRADNTGHPVDENDEEYEEGWWMKVLDGSYVNTMVEELEQAIAQAIEDAQEDIDDAIAGANAAAQAANDKIAWVEEQVDSLTAYEVATALDETSIIPVQNKVVSKEINNANSYLKGDVRTLAVGQEYLYDEKVKNADGKLLRLAKDVKWMTTVDAVAIGDLKVFYDISIPKYKTLKALKAIEQYDNSTFYAEGDYTIGADGSNNICKYDGSEWNVVTLNDMGTDTSLYEEIDLATLESTYTINDSSVLDINNRVAYEEALTLPSDANSYVIGTDGKWGTTQQSKHKLVSMAGIKRVRITAGANPCVFTFLKSATIPSSRVVYYATGAPIPYRNIAARDTLEIPVPEDANYFYYQYYINASGKYYSPSKLLSVKYVKDVLEERVTNKWIADNEYIWQTHRMNKIIDSFTNLLPSERTSGLALVHCSDIHGDASNLSRVMRFTEQNPYLDDAIHTGDMVYCNKGDKNGATIQQAGADKMLQVIGNHDHWGNREAAYTDAQKFVRYMKGISSWNCVYEQNLCYYYKDYYTDTRLIVLDCMQWSGSTWNAQQSQWFVDTLESARTANRRVVVATHCPVSSIVDIKSGFSDRGTINETEINTYCPANVRTAIKTAVQNFINAGGTFVCYLTGHTHFNTLGWLHDYPDQFQITMANSGAYKSALDSTNMSAYKHRNLINRDEFNVLFVRAQYLSIARFGRQYNYWWQKADTITIDYVNKEVIGC